MNNRQLFQEIMFYGEFDRMPVIHWDAWQETLERWHKEGIPRGVNVHEFLDARPHWSFLRLHHGLFPAFDEETIKETDEYRIFRNGSGVIIKDWKHKSSIPHQMDFSFKTARDWDNFKSRLQPDPARISADLDEQIAALEASDQPIAVTTASMMGLTRNWMGVENMSYLMYDARDVFSDIVMTFADLTCWLLDQALPKIKVDLGFSWEDICGRNGPLVSPKIFDECVAPGYRKIRNKLEEYGVTLFGVDSDGDVTNLVGNWLEAGVNLQFPLEVGVWKGDALDFRKKYGKDLRIVGNFDKFALEKNHASVEAEFQRLLPLMKEGGFVMMPDHVITPGVALEDYRWYLNQVREMRF